jgi:hypothetical protein
LVQAAVVTIAAVLEFIDTTLCQVTGINGACVGVIAGIQVGTPGEAIAGIRGAQVVVVATIVLIHAIAGYQVAGVQRTQVVIVAILGREHTSKGGIALIILGAQIVVRAYDGGIKTTDLLALFIHTFAHGTGVSVGAF